MPKREEKRMITRNRKIGILLIACLLTVGFASAYAKGGNPFDELWTHILNTDNRLIELEAKIAILEGLISIGPPGFGAPDYDSGWQTLPPGSFAYKDLFFDTSVIYDINNTLVYMEGRFYSTSTDTFVVHQTYYGGTSGQYQYGFWWQMSDDHVLIHKLLFDSDADEIRVRIWQLPPPPT